jgi:hypothetical protein
LPISVIAAPQGTVKMFGCDPTRLVFAEQLGGGTFLMRINVPPTGRR